MRQLAAESCLNESHQRCVYLIHQRIEAEVKSLSILLSARVFLSLSFFRLFVITQKQANNMGQQQQKEQQNLYNIIKQFAVNHRKWRACL